MNPETYIQPGDEVSVMFRSLDLCGFSGTVIEVGPGDYGRRTFLIQKAGTDLAVDGAIGVLETRAVFAVRRGDSWIHMPLPLVIEEAEAKVGRMAVNERKRIEKKVPLFADQIEVQERSADRWVANERSSAAERLEHDHGRAMEANLSRAGVEALISTADVAYLRGRRERYPKDATYGIMFWRKQFSYFREHGEIERIVYKQTIAENLKFDWLKYDAPLTWSTAPGCSQKVVVLWVGPTKVLCRLTGEPFKDFDPRQYPEGRNVWLVPGDFAESNCATAAAVPYQN